MFDIHEYYSYLCSFVQIFIRSWRDSILVEHFDEQYTIIVKKIAKFSAEKLHYTTFQNFATFRSW